MARVKTRETAMKELARMQAAGCGPVDSMYFSTQQAAELVPEQLELGRFELRQLHRIRLFLQLQNEVLEARTA